MNNYKEYSFTFSERIKSGDHEAFKEFFFDNYHDVLNFIYRMTFDRDAALDLTQDTFLNFYKSLDKINPAISPNYYLFRIAKNLTINFLTRKNNNLHYDEENEETYKDFYSNPEDEYSTKFFEKDVQKAVEALPNRCRAVFILSRFHNLTYQEISETLEISLQTVKNQINKAIAILRKKLSHYLD